MKREPGWRRWHLAPPPGPKPLALRCPNPSVLVRCSLAVLLAGLAPMGAHAQTAPAGFVTALEGTATRTPAGQPAAVPLKFKDAVVVRDRIETRLESLVRVLLGGKAIVTVRELSVLTITADPDNPVVELGKGRAAVAVVPRLLGTNQTLQIRTPNAVAAIRGSEVVA